MALKMQKKGTATVSTEMKDGGKVIAEDTKTEAVDPPPATELQAKEKDEAPWEDTTPWCQVSMEASYTHNLGNYQSARIQVGLMIPCKHHEIEKVYEYVETWVDGKMQEKMAELTS